MGQRVKAGKGSTRLDMTPRRWAVHRGSSEICQPHLDHQGLAITTTFANPAVRLLTRWCQQPATCYNTFIEPVTTASAHRPRLPLTSPTPLPGTPSIPSRPPARLRLLPGQQSWQNKASTCRKSSSSSSSPSSPYDGTSVSLQRRHQAREHWQTAPRPV